MPYLLAVRFALLLPQQTVTLPPARVSAPPVVSEALAQDDMPDVPMPPKALLNRMNVVWSPVPAGAPGARQPDTPETFVGPEPGAGLLAAPGDFRVFLNVQGGTGGSPADPAVSAHADTVLYTGNTFARLSTNGGQSFTPLNPFTLFP